MRSASALLMVSVVFVGGAIEVSGAQTAGSSRKFSLTAAEEERVQELLGRMTLEEKLGQINMPCLYLPQMGEGLQAKREACRRFAAGTYEPGIGPGGGFFTLADSAVPEGPRRQAEFFNELQAIAASTRLGIPLLQIEEGTHGLMAAGGTIFPEGLALGSTWDLDLIGRVYGTAAREARAVGIHVLNTLVVEPYRDPRLGRSQEGYSEDPLLCAEIARTIVQAMQGDSLRAPDRVVASLSHFPGQSEPVSGLERGAMEISPRKLREIFLPPWVAGLQAGALSLMATYPALDGIPVHGSPAILTGLLREELGFEGIVLSEGEGISTLIYEGLAGDQAEAGRLALQAGVDVGISYERAYMSDLAAGVRQGLVDESLLDQAVARVLRVKTALGLFDQHRVDPARAESVVHAPPHQQLALEAARKAIVLLKNDGDLLPLRRDLKRIAVIGPNADHVRNQLGDYTAGTILHPVTTVLQGIRGLVSPQTEVVYARGCEVTGDSTDGFAEAIAVVSGADAAVVVLGENEWRAEGRQGTSGEAFDSATLELTGKQEELLKAVHATGTPTVLVLINGRPLAIRWASAHVPSILEAWCPGEKGGQAVAEVLFGLIEPEGRLPVTVPRHAGQLPVAYNYPKSKEYWITEGWGKPYVDLDPGPLYAFGHGLTYTKFEYELLEVVPSTIQPGEDFKVRVGLRNTGRRPGTELVQIYIRDLVSSVATPVQKLAGFRKVRLEPGAREVVEIGIPGERLALLDGSLQWTVEPGEFEVRASRSAADIRLRSRLVVAGSGTNVGGRSD